MKSQTPIQLSFTLSESEFVAGHRAYLRGSLLTFRTFAFLIVATTLAFAQAQILKGGGGALPILGVIWAGVFLLVAYVYWIMPPKLYQSRSKYSSPFRMLIDDRAITVEGASSEVIAWDQIQSVMERNQLFLIVRKGHLPVLIPARAFQLSGALEEFRSRISSK